MDKYIIVSQCNWGAQGGGHIFNCPGVAARGSISTDPEDRGYCQIAQRFIDADMPEWCPLQDYSDVAALEAKNAELVAENLELKKRLEKAGQ